MTDPITMRLTGRFETQRPGPVPYADALGSLYLVTLGGRVPGALHPLVPGGTRLGRAADNVVHLTDEGVSRYHAFLRTDEAGVTWLTDLGSTNGTYRESELLDRQTPVALRHGDRLRFGVSCMLKFIHPDPCEEQFLRALYDRAVRDPLTGLHNRLYFLDRAEALAGRAGLSNQGLAVLLLDVDHFKYVNDTYGHEVGDAVLREVATVLRQSTRPADLVARYGGEEFVIALPVPSPELAQVVAERVRANVAARTVDAHGQAIHVTVTIGTAFVRPGAFHSVDPLVREADDCLYRGKAAGRDRVVNGPSIRPREQHHPGHSLAERVSLG